MDRRTALTTTATASCLWPSIAAAGSPADRAGRLVHRWRTRRALRWSTGPRDIDAAWEDHAAMLLVARELHDAGEAVQRDARVQALISALAPEGAERAAVLVDRVAAAAPLLLQAAAQDTEVAAALDAAGRAAGVPTAPLAQHPALSALSAGPQQGPAGMVAAFDTLAQDVGLTRTGASLALQGTAKRSDRKHRRRLRRLGVLLFFVGLVLAVLSFGHAPILVAGLAVGVVGLALFVWSFVAIVVGDRSAQRGG